MGRTLIGTLCVLLAGVGLMACAQSAPKKLPIKNIGATFTTPDSTIVEAIGDTIIDVLTAPSKVNVYLIEPKSEPAATDHEVEPHFIRGQYIGTLDKKFIDVVNYVLVTDPQNYSNDSTAVQTFYMPVVELEYVKKKQSVSVVISPNDGTWSVVSHKKCIFNHNFKNSTLVNRMVTDIQALAEETKNTKKK